MSDEQEIKQIIREYIKVDDDLATLNKQAKLLRQTKKDMEEQIKEYMLSNELGNVDLNAAGTLKLSKTKLSKKINKKIVLDVLINSLSDHDKVNEIYEELFNEDSLDEITKLERSKKKNNQSSEKN